MSTEQNKARYRRFIEERFNQGRLETVDELLAPEYVFHDAPPGSPSGPERVKAVIRMFRGAFPDLQITIEQQVAEGDLVGSLATTRGTHRGELFGVPATGKTIVMTGMTLVRFANGRMVESRVKNDQLGPLRQLGLTPRPAAHVRYPCSGLLRADLRPGANRRERRQRRGQAGRRTQPRAEEEARRPAWEPTTSLDSPTAASPTTAARGAACEPILIGQESVKARCRR